MKKAVGHLIPFMEKEREENKTHAGIEEEASHLSRPVGPGRNWPQRRLLGWGRDHGAWLCLSLIDKIER